MMRVALVVGALAGVNAETWTSSIDPIDHIYAPGGMLSENINEATHFRNVVLKANELHFYGLAPAARDAVVAMAKLPSYKRHARGRELFDLPAPTVVVHDHALDTSICAGGAPRREFAFFVSPWHTQNMFHLHNDNVLALAETLRQHCDPETLRCEEPSVLYALAGDRNLLRHEIPILDLLFDARRPWTSAFSTAPVCFSHFVWGRGPCLFYHKEWLPRAAAAVAAVRRRVHGALGIAPKAGGPPTAIYVTRGTTGGRSIRDSGSVMDACRDHGFVCTECCDWSEAVSAPT